MNGQRRIVLDSTPLGLILHRPGLPEADACRAWAEAHRVNGVQIVVPDVIAYEVRRELLRLDRRAAVAGLDRLIAQPNSSRLALDEPALRLAAELWAQVRRQGKPTADAAALDIDVILAAQVLTAGWPLDDVIVATSNAKHVGLFVPAADWADI